MTNREYNEDTIKGILKKNFFDEYKAVIIIGRNQVGVGSLSDPRYTLDEQIVFIEAVLNRMKQ